MSIKNNTTSLQSLLEAVNALPEAASGSHDIEDAFITKALTSYTNDRVTTIGSYAFYACSKLTTASFPSVTDIRNSAFYACSKLTTASFPAATNIGYGAFGRCNKLTTISFPSVTDIGGCAFDSCNNLTTISFPSVTTIGSYAFDNCNNLTTASFPAATNIMYCAFRDCHNLLSLYLTNSYVCTLENSNAFKNTFTDDARGKIYVPSSLVYAYRKATNWTYYASAIIAINGEPEEPDADFFYFYIDGIKYMAGRSMTWADWCDSQYNTGFFVYTDDFIYEEPDDSYTIFIDNTQVKPTDIILSTNYTLSN